jgi:hypothetical protein
MRISRVFRAVSPAVSTLRSLGLTWRPAGSVQSVGLASHFSQPLSPGTLNCGVEGLYRGRGVAGNSLDSVVGLFTSAGVIENGGMVPNVKKILALSRSDSPGFHREFGPLRTALAVFST